MVTFSTDQSGIHNGTSVSPKEGAQGTEVRVPREQFIAILQ